MNFSLNKIIIADACAIHREVSGQWILREASASSVALGDNIGENDIKTDEQLTVLLPVFTNLHAHLGESLFKNYKKPVSLCDYLTDTEEFHRKFSIDEQKMLWDLSANYTANLMLKNGITSFSAARCDHIASQYGMESISLYPVMNSDKLKMFGRTIGDFRRFSESVKTNNSNVGIFFHSLYKTEKEDILFARQCLNEDVFFIIHISEDSYTTELEFKKYGNPIRFLHKNQLLTKKTLLVHGCCFTDNDLDIIAKTGSSICICPESNINVGSKPLNPEKLKKYGIPWCVATDGLGTANSLSIWQQLKCLKNIYPRLSNNVLLDGVFYYPINFFYDKKEIQGHDLYNNSFQLYQVPQRYNLDDLLIYFFEKTPSPEMVVCNGKIKDWR